MTPPWEKLDRVLIAHVSCLDPGVTFRDDLVGEGLWLTGRCGGCGATIREAVAAQEVFAGFLRLVADAGVDVGALATAVALEHDDHEGAGQEESRHILAPHFLTRRVVSAVVAADGVGAASARMAR